MIVQLKPKMTQSPPSNPPPRWGEDDLTRFLEDARHNQWATFANKKPIMGKIIEIDALLLKFGENLQNTPDELAALLMTRCFSTYRASAGLAMAGQVAETYVQCRAMLEYAAYALHIHKNPALGPLWLRRHDDDASMEAQKTAFSHRKVLASVKAANVHAGKRFEDLYQQTIDFGGHPNERSVTGNLKIVEDAHARDMQSIFLHEDGISLDLGLKTVARCGLTSMEMLQTAFNARFELLGINAAMLGLRSGL